MWLPTGNRISLVYMLVFHALFNIIVGQEIFLNHFWQNMINIARHFNHRQK